MHSLRILCFRQSAKALANLGVNVDNKREIALKNGHRNREGKYFDGIKYFMLEYILP